MTDDRDIRLGLLLAEAEQALLEQRYADADAIIARAGDDRAELLDMLEVALALRGPAQPSAERIEALAASPMFDLRSWPEILAEARKAAGIKRAEAVAGLAERIGVRDEPALERLEERYHELETGQLSPTGVKPALVDALGDLLGGIRETLAATRLNPLPDLGPQAVLNRSANEGVEMSRAMALPDAAPAAAPSAEERLVDDLFGV